MRHFSLESIKLRDVEMEGLKICFDVSQTQRAGIVMESDIMKNH